MITIENICPICGTERTYEFEDDNRGENFPEEGPWDVPCSECEKKLIDAVSTGKGNGFGYVDLLLSCLFGDWFAIRTARAMIGVS